MSIHIFRLLRLRACRIAQRKAPLVTSRTAHPQLTHSPTHSPAQSPRHSISRSEHPDNPKQKRADLQPIIGASGAVEGTRTLTVSHRNLNPARMPISPRLQAQLLYHKAGICKAFAASAQKNQKQCKNGCFFSDYLLYCYSLAGVTQW